MAAPQQSVSDIPVPPPTDDDDDDDDDLVPPIPPDGGWGWVVVVGSLFCNIIVDGVCFSFGVFLPTFVDYFNETRAKIAIVGSLIPGMYLGMGPVVSALANKYGCRNVTMAGAVMAAISFFASTFSPNVEVLIITYGILGGIGFGLMYLPAIVIVGFYFDKRRAFATGLAVCGSGIGTFLFAPFGRFPGGMPQRLNLPPSPQMETPTYPNRINPEARLKRCRKSLIELEESFLEDPEPDTIYMTSETGVLTTKLRYKELIEFSREYLPWRESYKILIKRCDPKSLVFSKARHHSTGVEMNMKGVTERHTSSIYVYPSMQKAYTTKLIHEMPKYIRCWSVSDEDHT